MQARSYLLTSFLLLSLTACDRFASTAYSTITIKGTVSGWDSGWVYVTVRESGLRERNDSVSVQKGVFTYESPAPEPRHYRFEHGQTVFSAFLDPGSITITGDANNLDAIQVTGSPSYEESKPLVRNLNEREQRYDQYFSFRDSVTRAGTYPRYADSLNGAFQKALATFPTTYESIIKRNPNSKAAIAYFFDYYPVVDSLAAIKRVYNLFGDDAKHTSYGQAIATRISRADSVQVGRQAPIFSQKSATGQTISLSDYRGKYVLLDFWASWCAPCRSENPTIVATYNKLKTKNFTILGISLDTDKGAWLQAIKDDKLNWSQVSDLKAFDNAIAVQYVVESIPSNFLIDPTGKIIARDLRGDQLTATLSKVIPE